MVGSSKIGGKVLTMDDQNHTLVESLIRIYQEKHRKKEQVITKQNFMDAVFTDILKPIIKHEPIIKNYPSEKIIDSVYDNKVYYEAFRLCEKIYGNTFLKGKINGHYLTLLRNKSSNCILSKRKHEAENAYLCIREDVDVYIIYFGCYRNCNPNKKTMRIGCITKPNFISFVDPLEF